MLVLLGLVSLVHGGDEPKKDKAGAAATSSSKVSYDKQIRPIFQARCQGCHQPAKAGGGYVMTAFDRLQEGRRERRAGGCAGQA